MNFQGHRRLGAPFPPIPDVLNFQGRRRREPPLPTITADVLRAGLRASGVYEDAIELVLADFRPCRVAQEFDPMEPLLAEIVAGTDGPLKSGRVRTLDDYHADQPRCS